MTNTAKKGFAENMSAPTTPPTPESLPETTSPAAEKFGGEERGARAPSEASPPAAKRRMTASLVKENGGFRGKGKRARPSNVSHPTTPADSDTPTVSSPLEATPAVTTPEATPAGTPEPVGGPRGRKSRIKEEKICWVCGDKALGFNFDAISCESCKAFFRRNAYKEGKNWKCVYESNCEITVKSRRFCQVCRLEKCVKVGMRKEWILKEDEKLERKKKILQNKEVTKSGSKEDAPLSQSCPLSPVSPSTPPSESGNIFSIGPRKQLTPEDSLVLESILLNFQLTVMRHFHIISQEKGQMSNEKFDSMYTLLNMTHEIVRGFIRFAKTLKPFVQLNQEDQIALLKGGMIECIIISSAMLFDMEKRCWRDTNLTDSILLLFNCPETLPDVNIHAEHTKFMLHLLRDPRPDNTSLILLMVISFFASDRPLLTAPAKDFIHNWQCRYTELLSLYLSSVHEARNSSTLLPRLLMALTSVRTLHALHSRRHLTMNQEQIDPLLVEVYDIHGLLQGAKDEATSSRADVDSTDVVRSSSSLKNTTEPTMSDEITRFSRNEKRSASRADSAGASLWDDDVKPDVEALNAERQF